ncbi:hypothetical protein TNCV_1564751 [Trichonephila clavipes]|nr:hypothetical protein TNCV_1564751 [Trichonephila clavipes]
MIRGLRKSDENGGRVGTHHPVVFKRDAEVDDPGLRKERRERWPTRPLSWIPCHSTTSAAWRNSLISPNSAWCEELRRVISSERGSIHI